MKNQYFGDINDYKKYSLLRLLGGQGQIKTAICWVLTEDDNRTDGSKIKYLEQPDKWHLASSRPSQSPYALDSSRESSERRVAGHLYPTTKRKRGGHPLAMPTFGSK